MTIVIPHWLLWMIGIPVGLFLLLCLYVGIVFIIGMWNWSPPI